MPVYQYACTQCGEQLEVRQSFTDATLTECPACAGRLRKVLNAVGVVFKGSGFYRTDSRAAASAESAGSGSAKEPATAKGGESSPTPDGSRGTKESSSGSVSNGSAAKSSSTKRSSDTSSSGGSSGGGKPTPAAAH